MAGSTPQEVCGLSWSPNGLQLASGGNDNLLHVWGANGGPPTLRLTDHARLTTLQPLIPSYLSRASALRRGAEQGTVLRMNQAYGYKLISSLASSGSVRKCHDPSRQRHSGPVTVQLRRSTGGLMRPS